MVQSDFHLIQRQVHRSGNDAGLCKGDLAQAQETGDDIICQASIASFQAGHYVIFEAAVFLGWASRISPPATVCIGEKVRKMKRSPAFT